MCQQCQKSKNAEYRAEERFVKYCVLLLDCTISGRYQKVIDDASIG